MGSVVARNGEPGSRWARRAHDEAVAHRALGAILETALIRCPFCELPPTGLAELSPLVVAFRDAHPVAPGHTLVIPRRHVATFFDASPEEHVALLAGVLETKRALDAELHPDGYNVGFNAGAAAGQTVMHAHVHVIPRFAGDVSDPRGGVRGVIAHRQEYEL